MGNFSDCTLIKYTRLTAAVTLLFLCVFIGIDDMLFVLAAGAVDAVSVADFFFLSAVVLLLLLWLARASSCVSVCILT